MKLRSAHLSHSKDENKTYFNKKFDQISIFPVYRKFKIQLVSGDESSVPISDFFSYQLQYLQDIERNTV